MNRVERAAWQLWRKRVKALEADVRLFESYCAEALPDPRDVEMLRLVRAELARQAEEVTE